MIKLSRLNNTVLVVNAELIEYLEATPDTVITLTTGHKLVVKEDIDQVIEKVINYRRRIKTPLSAGGEGDPQPP
ncbi:MAG: flagellar FlbD family protein [Syntrophomonadaceae bacterium]|nr:flagellar FlbD family protein [Syntrophomonadaceae bacterium]